ncbi:MAG TPA: AsmA family protein, partial [Verrucomicrobiae bacterium]|nr:AsmA family protein [Verrucomicrobiae bacterium]
RQKAQTVTGDLTLTNLDAHVGANAFAKFGSVVKFDVASSPEQIQINQVAGSFSQDGQSGGGFGVSGTYKTAQKSADMNVNFSGVNENALRPFLESALGGKKLVSVAINGAVSAQYNPQAGSAVKADVQVTNLVVNDPSHQFPATPLAVGFQADASLNGQAADVRQFQIALTPTARAANQINFNGHVDFSKTNAIQGNFKLAADSLDFSQYYDLFAGGTNAPAKPVATATTTPAPAPANAGQEPAPVNLPLQNFTLAADIGRLYLHEVAVSNFVMTTKIDGGHIVMKPFQLVLNGAPVNATADLDLGVPGYQYNVGFNARAIPLAPLVDTFQPARAGQVGGTLNANAQISGAGVTGASLQKNLSGNFGLNMTNLELSVINVHSRILKTLINVVATIPELIKSPESGIASLLGSVTGTGGLMNELQQSPIEAISMQATAGNGLVNLQSATVQSAAFKADAPGTITLNEVLTNSTLNIPVTVALSRDIAGKLNVSSTTPSANAAYVPLPQFLTITGTVGSPKPDINKLVLAGMAAHSFTGNLLNSSGTNASPVKGLLNKFLHFGK